VLARAMSPPHFPITPLDLRGNWHFRGLAPGDYELEGFSVLALEVPHKGGRTFGYRISDGRVTLAYISDHCPTGLGPGPDGLGEYHEAALRLVSGCDILFHDAQYTDEELPARAYFGHSSSGYAVRLAERAGVKRLVLYHHDPQRTDDQVDKILSLYQGGTVTVEAATGGSVIDLIATY
jgi:phosphoribosyl 1,2-cyclic phosphodiesterase